MNKIKIAFALFVLVFSGCKPHVVKYTINGAISGAAGKYIKIIDMTVAGFIADSIELDMGGKFTYEKVSSQPGDYILYFKNANYIRVTPLPNETVNLKGNYHNLIETHTITGSAETERVSEIIKRHHKSVAIIDTLPPFYMKNQLHPALDSIVDRLKFITDSVYQNEKTYLENYIEKNPATLASYIALSQKLGQNLNLFTLQNDLKYFEMVDNALFQRFDTIAITNMLHAYVVQGKIKLQQQITENQKSLIGKQAPEISLSNAYGDTLKLSQLKGKYVLVDFWGTWCRPCRKENKNLSALYPKYRYKGFEIFQVAIERNKTDWKNTIREDKLFWKYQVSELNYMESETAKIYQVKALPANYLVNPEGIIIDQNLFGDSLQSKLAELFPPKPLPQIQNGQ
jgi:peroxiredoxin